MCRCFCLPNCGCAGGGWLSASSPWVTGWSFSFTPLHRRISTTAASAYPPIGTYHTQGLAAHWNKNNNVGWAFDTWFLNLFPRQEAFLFNGGGYCTLSFIPTLATMILGLIGGELLRRGPTGR